MPQFDEFDFDEFDFDKYDYSLYSLWINYGDEISVLGATPSEIQHIDYFRGQYDENVLERQRYSELKF